MDHFGEYDYVIVNRDLEDSVQKVRTILAAARLAAAKPDRAIERSEAPRDLPPDAFIRAGHQRGFSSRHFAATRVRKRRRSSPKARAIGRVRR